MASRIHRLGTIFSRIDGLIRKGHMKDRDKPIWFDVYKTFPPKYEPTFKRKVPDVRIKEIFYKEDTLRAKIHKALPPRVNVITLNSNTEILSEKLLKSCQQHISKGMPEDEAVETVVGPYKNFHKEAPTTITTKHIRGKRQKEDKETMSTVDVQKMLDEIF